MWTDAGPHFVDFDDSRMAPAIQDLWLLLPGDREGASRALADLLAGYEDFCEFEPRELHLVEALRTLRLIHYAAWLARRWDDPAFPAAFRGSTRIVTGSARARVARADRRDAGSRSGPCDGVRAPSPARPVSRFA